MNSGDKEDINHAITYLHLDKKEGYHWGFIRGCWSSVGDIAMAQVQDILGLGSEARINTPPFLPNNWIWRLKENSLDDHLAEKLYQITERYDRLNEWNG